MINKREKSVYIIGHIINVGLRETQLLIFSNYTVEGAHISLQTSQS